MGLKTTRTLFALMMASAVLSPAAHAQDAGGDRGPALNRHVVGGSFGHTILFGDWGTYFDDNFSFAGFYAYEATPVFGFLFNVSYSQHEGIAEDRLTIWGIEPNIKINLAYFDSVAFYTFAGFGLYPVSQKIGPAEGSVLAFGMNFGFGVNLLLGDNFVFGPAIAFRSAFDKTDASVRNGDFPNGMNIGGESLRLYVQAGYAF